VFDFVILAFLLVIPAKAGIQRLRSFLPLEVQGFPRKIWRQEQGAGFRLSPE